MVPSKCFSEPWGEACRGEGAGGAHRQLWVTRTWRRWAGVPAAGERPRATFPEEGVAAVEPPAVAPERRSTVCRRDPCWPGPALSSAVQSGGGRVSMLGHSLVLLGPRSGAWLQAGHPFLWSRAEPAFTGTSQGRVVWVPLLLVRGWRGACTGQAPAKEPLNVAAWGASLGDVAL